MPVDNFHDMIEKIGINQMFTGEIDGNLDRFTSCRKPSADITAYKIEHVKIQIADFHALLQERDKISRRHYIAVAEPAAESLDMLS